MMLIKRCQAPRWRLPRIVLGNEMAALNRCAYSSVGGIKAVRSKGVHTYDKRLVMENLEPDAKFFVGEGPCLNRDCSQVS